MPRVVPTQAVDFIDRLFPKIRNQEPGERRSLIFHSTPQAVALLEIIQQIPPELITVSHEDYVEFISSVAALRNFIEVCKTNRDARLESIQGLRPLNPIALIRQALAKCPDEFPSSSTSELTFISDNQLREQLRLDIGSIERAFANFEWKAATVLAGSVIEALLLSALVEHQPKLDDAIEQLLKRKVLKKKPHDDLQWWDLHEYIEVAAEIKLVSKDTLELARLARGFRNLIHPGKAQRLQETCNRATAMTAIAALERVAEQLTNNLA